MTYLFLFNISFQYISLLLLLIYLFVPSGKQIFLVLSGKCISICPLLNLNTCIPLLKLV